MRSTLHHSSPQIFSLAVYRLRGDCKSPGFIGRTFFYSGLQIRWDASRKTIANPLGRLTVANPLGRLTVANPLGRLTEDRRLTESVRNPWSKNALLTQRNPMKKYPGEEWVKSGEEWCATLHLSEPQCLSGFQTIW